MAALAVLGVFFLNTWQGFRFQSQERQIDRLEQQQKDWVEENKKIVAAMAILSSPTRLGPLAESRLGLRPLEARREIKLRLEPAGSGRDE